MGLAAGAGGDVAVFSDESRATEGGRTICSSRMRPSAVESSEWPGQPSRRALARTLLLVLAIAVGLTLPSTGHAAVMRLWVMAEDKASIETINGVAGTNYVMSNPIVADGHVSSVYCWRNNGDLMTECGWAADVLWYGGAPHYFVAWTDHGSYYLVHLGTAPNGTYHRYSIRPQTTSSFNWQWLIDGQLVRTQYITFTLATPLCSSERASLGDTNYSHFSALRKRSKYTGDWWDWKTLGQKVDNDDSYYLNKVSNTECYMQQ